MEDPPRISPHRSEHRNSPMPDLKLRIIRGWRRALARLAGQHRRPTQAEIDDVFSQARYRKAERELAEKRRQ